MIPNPRPQTPDAINVLSRTSCGLRARTFIIDAKTGRTLKKSGWSKNTMMNHGLNVLAGNGALGPGFAGVISAVNIGSSNTQNYTYNAAITFTQAGTALTASGSFFTPAMVGQLFKYGTGTGGSEYYITAYTSPILVTVDTSAVLATPAAGTVWNVIMSDLLLPLFTTTAILSDPGNGTIIPTPGVAQLTRKFTFPIQSAPYTVNEIGYGVGASGSMTQFCGRVVLGSSDVVPVTSYYVVQVQLICNVSPCAAAVAFANTGTNINIAGTGIFAFYSFLAVATTTGNPISYQGLVGGSAGGLMDSETCGFSLVTTPFSLPGGTSPGANTATNTGYISPQAFFTASSVGISTASGAFNFTTAGETLYGFLLPTAVGSPLYICNDFQLRLTTPQALPSGVFQGTWAFTNVFSRTLSNP